MNVMRTVGGVAVTAAATIVVLSTAIGPASAHVKVTAEGARAGATDVTVTFEAEAESKKAGIVSLQTTLPDGMSPGDVSLVSGPTGWKLKPTADGFTISGIALPQGENATFSVKFAKLPGNLKQLPLKTVERYSNGEVNRWVDTTKSVAKEEENAAPVIELQPAAAGTGAQQGSNAARTSDSGLPTAVWLVIVVGVVAVIGLVVFLRSRRR
jgi:hypothetical protein